MTNDHAKLQVIARMERRTNRSGTGSRICRRITAGTSRSRTQRSDCSSRASA